MNVRWIRGERKTETDKEREIKNKNDRDLKNWLTEFNLQAPRFLYIGQAFRYSPENAFYTFNQQIYFIIW